MLGKEGEEADAYAREVIKSDFEEPGEEDVVRKVASDLQNTGTSESEIREQMDSLLKGVMEEEKS